MTKGAVALGSHERVGGRAIALSSRPWILLEGIRGASHFNGYSDIDGTVFKRDFPSSTAPIWDTRSYRQIQEQILPMQRQI